MQNSGWNKKSKLCLLWKKIFAKRAYFVEISQISTNEIHFFLCLIPTGDASELFILWNYDESSFIPCTIHLLVQYISVFSIRVDGKFEIKQIIIRKNAAFLFQPSVRKSVTRIAINEFVQPPKPILFWRFSREEVGKKSNFSLY